MDTQQNTKPLPDLASEQRKLSSDQLKVAATGFASLFSLIGIMFYGLSFFYDFWVKDLGWSRVTITSGSAFGRITAALLGFLVGWLIDKFGPRRLILTGVVLGGFAFVGFGLMADLWQFYLFSLMAALGYISGGPLPNQVLTTRWFNQSRGKAMGFAYIGVGVGGMLVPQIARYLNAQFGWHTSLILLGVLMILIAFPIAFSAKDTPPGSSIQKSATAERDIPIKEILKNRSLYLLMIGSTCSIAAVSGTSQHLKLFFSIDLNFTQEQSANLLSIVLFASILGRLFMGWLADRIAKKYVMILIYALVAAAIPMLYFATSPGVIYVFAFVFGMALGGDYMIIPLMTAELFGIKVLGKVMGIILTTDVIADALSPMLVGWIRDKTGSYFKGFEILIALAIIGTVVILLLPKKAEPAKDQSR